MLNQNLNKNTTNYYSKINIQSILSKYIENKEGGTSGIDWAVK